MSDIANEGYQRLEERCKTRHVPGSVRTGLKNLDQILGGICPGDLALVAGRPGMGKTSLCAGIAIDAAMRQGKTVAVISLEMSQAQVYDAPSPIRPRSTSTT